MVPPWLHEKQDKLVHLQERLGKLLQPRVLILPINRVLPSSGEIPHGASALPIDAWDTPGRFRIFLYLHVDYGPVHIGSLIALGGHKGFQLSSTLVSPDPVLQVCTAKPTVGVHFGNFLVESLEVCISSVIFKQTFFEKKKKKNYYCLVYYTQNK